MAKRCIYCGNKVNIKTNSCTKCGREAKPLISIAKLEYKTLDDNVKQEVTGKLEEGKGPSSKGDRNKLLMAIKSGDVSYTEAIYDGFERRNASDDSYYTYHIKVKTPDLSPIDTQIHAYGISEERVKSDELEKLYIYRVKNNNAYWYFVGDAQSNNSFADELLLALGYYGKNYEPRVCAGFFDALFG